MPQFIFKKYLRPYFTTLTAFILLNCFSDNIQVTRITILYAKVANKKLITLQMNFSHGRLKLTALELKFAK